MSKYLAYCMDKEGYYNKPTSLTTEEHAITFCVTNMQQHHEIRITDIDDFIVMNAIDGKITYPTEEMCEGVKVANSLART